MKSLLLAAAAALSLGFAAPAAADPISVIGSAGGWRIKANHEVCVGDRSFTDSGTTLAFAVYSSGTANILIQNRLWSIPDGTYPVDVSIDRGSPVTFETSFYAKEQALVLEWNLTAEQIRLVSNGAVFFAKVGSANYRYSLAGSGEMLRAVIDCVGTLRRAANPYAGTPAAGGQTAPANPFAENASNPYRRM